MQGNLFVASIDHLVIRAEDSYTCDIISVAEKAFGFINVLLQQNCGVLIHCYGGVNRSGAVAAAYLVKEKKLPLCTAVQCLRQVRGTVLTNQTFCKQLIQYCIREGLKIMAVVDDEPLSREDSSIKYVAGAPGCGNSSCLLSMMT